MRVKELAAWLNAAFEGDPEQEIRGVAPIDDAAGDEIAFVTPGRGAKSAAVSQAGCLLVREDWPNPNQRSLIRVKDPRAAMARIIPLFHPQVEPTPGIHPSAVVGERAAIDPTAHIG